MSSTDGGKVRLFLLHKAGGDPIVERARRVVEALSVNVDLEVVDLSVDVLQAETARIIATPTLLVECSGCRSAVVGDLQDIPAAVAAIEAALARPGFFGRPAATAKSRFGAVS